MWFIAGAWARSKGAHGAVQSVQQHAGAGQNPSDHEIGLALIAGAILICIGWALFEFYKMYRGVREVQRFSATRTARDR